MLTGKGETEAQAQERFAYVRKQKRLAKNRDTARRSRQAKKERLRSLQNRIEFLELEQIRSKQAVLQRDEQLLQMRSLPATPRRVHSFEVDRDRLPGPQARTVLSEVSATPNISSQRSDPHEVLRSQNSLQKAISAGSDLMDQREDIPKYLADFFLHSQQQVGHTSPNALDTLGLSPQADRACTHPLEAQNQLAVQSVQDAAPTRIVSCMQPDAQHEDHNRLSSFSDGSLPRAEKQMYGMQGQSVARLDCTNFWDRDHSHQRQLPIQAKQTESSQWDQLQCTTWTTGFHPMGMELHKRL